MFSWLIRRIETVYKCKFYRPQWNVMFWQAFVIRFRIILMATPTSVGDTMSTTLFGYSVMVHPCYGTVGVHPTEMLSCWCILHIEKMVYFILSNKLLIKHQCILTSNNFVKLLTIFMKFTEHVKQVKYRNVTVCGWNLSLSVDNNVTCKMRRMICVFMIRSKTIALMRLRNIIAVPELHLVTKWCAKRNFVLEHWVLLEPAAKSVRMSSWLQEDFFAAKSLAAMWNSAVTTWKFLSH